MDVNCFTSKGLQCNGPYIGLNVNFAVDVNIVNETCLELDFFSHCELVEMFLNTALEKGIDLDAKAHHGLTAMHYACMDRYEMRALRQRIRIWFKRPKLAFTH